MWVFYMSCRSDNILEFLQQLSIRINCPSQHFQNNLMTCNDLCYSNWLQWLQDYANENLQSSSLNNENLLLCYTQLLSTWGLLLSHPVISASMLSTTRFNLFCPDRRKELKMSQSIHSRISQMGTVGREFTFSFGLYCPPLLDEQTTTPFLRGSWSSNRMLEATLSSLGSSDLLWCCESHSPYSQGRYSAW